MSTIETETAIPVRLLGQSGCALRFADATLYLDPYLSNSVQELDAPDLARLMPVPLAPAAVTDADWVLISHGHIDHCDPHTLPAIANASAQARFVGPAPVVAALQSWGIAAERCVLAPEDWVVLAPGLRVRAVPAAHPQIERDDDGNLCCVGFVVDCNGRRLYFAGDTSVCDELLQTLGGFGGFDAAFLPVNERNYFRDRRGIIGNMSVREAFLLAEEVGIRQVVPVHWDMFSANSVSPAEIRAVYEFMRPDFELRLSPNQLEF